MRKYFYKLKFGSRIYFSTVCGWELPFTLPESQVPVSEYSFIQLLKKQGYMYVFVCGNKN